MPQACGISFGPVDSGQFFSIDGWRKELREQGLTPRERERSRKWEKENGQGGEEWIWRGGNVEIRSLRGFCRVCELGTRDKKKWSKGARKAWDNVRERKRVQREVEAIAALSMPPIALLEGPATSTLAPFTPFDRPMPLLDMWSPLPLPSTPTPTHAARHTPILDAYPTRKGPRAYPSNRDVPSRPPRPPAAIPDPRPSKHRPSHLQLLPPSSPAARHPLPISARGDNPAPSHLPLLLLPLPPPTATATALPQPASPPLPTPTIIAATATTSTTPGILARRIRVPVLTIPRKEGWSIDGVRIICARSESEERVVVVERVVEEERRRSE
ncbi:hypothetical protein MMC20_002228 [Loxospora ochrophaea]|nr:hypothetical protein [Loxospora ochrophaea]